MKILVLIAGVLDPKWPIVRSANGMPERTVDRLILSPFDEAALELALKLRDAKPDSTIRTIVAGGAAATRLARTVSAFNLAEVSTLGLTACWDQALVARQLALVCADCDLILIGREFGDGDDGLVPPLLAGLLGCDFFGRVQALEASDPPQFLRESGAFLERLNLAGRLVASVTNDRRTRLRKPLMKNVMMARTAPIGVLEIPAPDGAGVTLIATDELAGTRVPVPCMLFEGPIRHQAEQLAAVLLAPRP